MTCIKSYQVGQDDSSKRNWDQNSYPITNIICPFQHQRRQSFRAIAPQNFRTLFEPNMAPLACDICELPWPLSSTALSYLILQSHIYLSSNCHWQQNLPWYLIYYSTRFPTSIFLSLALNHMGTLRELSEMRYLCLCVKTWRIHWWI